MSEGAPPRLGHYPPPDFPIVVRGLAAVSRLLALLEGIGIGVCLTSLVGLAVYQSLTRNLRGHHQMWMPEAPDWVDGVIRHSVFLLGFLGAAYATFTARHIRIDAVTRMAKTRGRLALRVLVTLAALTVLYFIIRAGFGFYRVCLEEEGEATQKGQLFTSSRGAIIIIAGFSLIAFHFVVQLVMDAVYLIRGVEPPPSWISEASHGEAPPAAVAAEGGEAP